MDECIGSLMPLWAYFDFMIAHTSRSVRTELFKDMAKKISDGNTASRIWIMRPELDKVLIPLAQAQKEGDIYGCFILSNNGSAFLVQAAIEIMNYRAKQLTSTPYDLFVTGWYRNSPCRNNSMSKDFNTIQNCLRYEKLPTLQSTKHLLFYDDLNHQLSNEILNYIQVPPYYYVTPTYLIFDTLQSILHKYNINDKIINKTREQAILLEENDIRTDKDLIFNPPPESAKMDINIFVNGLMNFLGNGRFKKAKQYNFTRKASPRKSKTKSSPKKSKNYTRKKLRA